MAEKSLPNLAKVVELLPVPYVSQLGAGADEFHNDCGAASGAMLIDMYLDEHVDPDDFFKETGQTIDQYLSATQLIKVLAARGIDMEWRENMTLTDLFEVLAMGRPPIVLFNYGALRERIGQTENVTFNGAHFGVMIGIDTRNVYLHDPLWTKADDQSDGAAIAIPHADWMYIWTQAKRDQNPPCSALVPVEGPQAIGGIKEMYQVRIVSRNGLKVRSAPYVSLGTDTGQGVAYKDVVRIWAEEKDKEGNLWGAITISRKKWIAMTYQGITFAEKID